MHGAEKMEHNVWARLTTAIASDAIDRFLFATLEESSSTRLASTVMATMPGSTRTIALLPSYNALTHSSDGANELVAWDYRSIYLKLAPRLLYQLDLYFCPMTMNRARVSKFTQLSFMKLKV